MDITIPWKIDSTVISHSTYTFDVDGTVVTSAFIPVVSPDPNTHLYLAGVGYPDSTSPLNYHLFVIQKVNGWHYNVYDGVPAILRWREQGDFTYLTPLDRPITCSTFEDVVKMIIHDSYRKPSNGMKYRQYLPSGMMLDTITQRPHLGVGVINIPPCSFDCHDEPAYRIMFPMTERSEVRLDPWWYLRGGEAHTFAVKAHDMMEQIVAARNTIADIVPEYIDDNETLKQFLWDTYLFNHGEVDNIILGEYSTSGELTIKYTASNTSINGVYLDNPAIKAMLLDEIIAHIRTINDNGWRIRMAIES